MNVWNPNYFEFQTAQLCPILRQTRFWTYFSVWNLDKNLGALAWVVLNIYENFYNPKFSKQPSLLYPVFRQLDCPNFEYESRNHMSEIGTHFFLIFFPGHPLFQGVSHVLPTVYCPFLPAWVCLGLPLLSWPHPINGLRSAVC